MAEVIQSLRKARTMFPFRGIALDGARRPVCRFYEPLSTRLHLMTRPCSGHCIHHWATISRRPTGRIPVKPGKNGGEGGLAKSQAVRATTVECSKNNGIQGTSAAVAEKECVFYQRQASRWSPNPHPPFPSPIIRLHYPLPIRPACDFEQ